MTILLLIRHGQTAWNLEGKYSGQADIPLNETGRIQAQQVAKQIILEPVDAIFSSDLMRALETAAIVAGSCANVAENHHGVSVNVQTDPRLREINQGVWEGMHYDEIQGKYAAEFAAREANPLEVAAPGGETVGQVRKRVLAAVQEICNQYPDGRVVIVAHGLALAIVRSCLMKQPIHNIWSLVPSNAEVVRIRCSVAASLCN